MKQTVTGVGHSGQEHPRGADGVRLPAAPAHLDVPVLGQSELQLVELTIKGRYQVVKQPLGWFL